MKRYSSVATIAFTVHHSEPNPDAMLLDDVRAALIRRIADLDRHRAWDMAVDFTDTVEEQP